MKVHEIQAYTSLFAAAANRAVDVFMYLHFVPVFKTISYCYLLVFMNHFFFLHVVQSCTHVLHPMEFLLLIKTFLPQVIEILSEILIMFQAGYELIEIHAAHGLKFLPSPRHSMCQDIF